MRTSGAEPSGVLLLRLINTRIGEIVSREQLNDGRICLYGTGGWWTAFDRSAYSLSRLLPDLESFVVTPPGHPASVIGVSVPDSLLRRYLKGSVVSRKGSDYLEFGRQSFDYKEYGDWHSRKVSDFMDALV